MVSPNTLSIFITCNITFLKQTIYQCSKPTCLIGFYDFHRCIAQSFVMKQKQTNCLPASSHALMCFRFPNNVFFLSPRNSYHLLLKFVILFETSDEVHP